MEREEGESWAKAMPFMGLTPSLSFNNQSFNVANSQQCEQNWDNTLMLDYGAKVESLFSQFNQASGNPSPMAGSSNDQNKIPHAEDLPRKEVLQNDNNQDWDPRAMLSNLSFLEQKIHQLQELVRIIVGRSQVSMGVDELATQQQLITASVTSIIMQLTSTAASLFPSVNNGLLSANPSAEQLNGVFFPPAQSNGGPVQQNMSDANTHVQNSQVEPTGTRGEMEPCMDAHELKEEDDHDPIDEEHLPPGSYQILQLEKEEILAPHAHFCAICGKGFKRNANLRMHMRGHGDEYKTLAALAKPHKDSENLEPVLLKRYSCPSMGCKRNKEHKKFQPLKTLLCVKNHYKRTHCDKTYTCSRCNTKKFSIISDLKTHEKHCGKDKWLCSCGTSFSRKDKLFGHIALFQGHTPALPYEENKVLLGSSLEPVENGEASKNNLESMTFSDDSNGFGVGDIQSMIDGKGNVDDTYSSFTGFDGCNMVGLQDYGQSAYDDSGTSFPFLQ